MILTQITSLLLFFTVQGQVNCEYIIEGDYRSVDTGTIFLHSDNGGKIINSAPIDGGKFYMKGKIEEPFKCTLYSNIDNEPIPIFLENTVYRVLVTTDPFNYKITGGKMQAEFMKYVNAVNAYYEGWDKMKRLLANNSLWDNTNTTDSLRNEVESVMVFFEKEFVETSKLYIDQNRESYVAPRMISNLILLGKNHLRLVDSLFNTLAPKVKRSSEGDNLKDIISKLKGKLKIGDRAPIFTLKNEKNTDFHFVKPKKGNYILINFWATWCLPCVREIPDLMDAYKKYRYKGLEIINISLDKDRDKWLEYLEHKKMKWPQLIDGSVSSLSVAKAYKVNSIPSNFLINEQGNIIMIDVNVDSLSVFFSEKNASLNR